MTTWTYTFCDLLTGEELAILPVSGVQLSRALCGAGSFSGFVALMDPDVRALNPWRATVPRRTALYVERDGLVVWAGMLWGRKRTANKFGLILSGATFESWLAHRLLKVDLPGTGLSAGAMITKLLATLQAEPNGNIGLGVTTTGGVVRDRLWEAVNTNSALELIDSYTKTQTPIEFRIDVAKDPAGGYRKTLVVGETKLGRRAADAQLELRYPQGELLDWTDDEEGSSADNALFGVGGTPPALPGSPTDRPKVTAYRDAAAVNSSELTDGYPLLQGAYSATNQTSVPALTDVVDAQLLAGLNTQGRWSNVSVRPDGEFGVGKYLLGDDLTMVVTHPAFEEWPEPFTDSARIIGDTLTPAEGDTPESLKFTLGLDGRLATSVTLTATLTRLLARVAALETV